MLLVQNMHKNERKKFSSHYLDVPAIISHIDLDMVNINALQVGVAEAPFKNLEPLPPDNRESFFSQYFCEQRNGIMK